MTRRTLAVLGALLLPLTAVHAAADKAPRTIAGVENPYRTDAFAEGSDPMPAIDAALAAAQASGKRVLLVMGMNGCHDSAWLANLVASERFAPVRDRYHIVFADIGMPRHRAQRRGAETLRLQDQGHPDGRGARRRRQGPQPQGGAQMAQRGEPQRRRHL
jgi:hypothetical protein